MTKTFSLKVHQGLGPDSINLSQERDSVYRIAIAIPEANELMSRVHPRMPCILHPRDFDRWLDKEETERLPLDLLRLLPSDEITMFEVHPSVENVRNNGPELLRKAEIASESGVLPL